MLLRAIARRALRQTLLGLPLSIQEEISRRRRHPCAQALFHLEMERLLIGQRPVAWRVRKAWHELHRRRFTALCSVREQCGLPSDGALPQQT